MKLKILFVVFLIISGCFGAKTDKSSEARIIANSIDDKELMYESDEYPSLRKRLGREELQHDAAVLTAAFDRVYSGRDRLPAGVYEKLVSGIWTLAEKMPLGTTDNDGYLFCERLAGIFLNVPDNHLSAKGSCGDKIRKRVMDDVGRNIHTGQGYYFETRMIDGKRIGLLSLGTFMPDKNDLFWKGFKGKVANISKKTDVLIIDLRGNAGGMSDNLRWLASYLYGNPAKMVDETGIVSESAATFALFYNEPTLSIIKAMKNHQPVQPYLIKEKEDVLKGFEKFYKKPPQQRRFVRKGSDAPFDPKKGYDKPIRILIDGGCASACEGGYARFLSNPHVKTYGTNTAGAYHYGDNKPLVLPQSNVIVSIATSFREFADGRFIEKTGYAPEIHVPDGNDAFEAALKDLTMH